MDNATCPICGKSNNCALAEGRNPKDCWCMNVEFPKEVFDKIPKDKKDKACVCQSCLREIRASLEE